MTRYDEVPYPSFSYVHTHPDRLATVATLLDLAPTSIEHCRVLVIGCASGGNIIPMAYSLPQSAFVGIDLAPRQIAEGQEAVDALGLPNVALHCMDIVDITPEFGTFDYIIAHGFYSWVPLAIRDQLLRVCHDNLAPNGVAYVSYNVYPGWRLMAILREAMRYQARDFTTPAERLAQARVMLNFLHQEAASSSAYGHFLKAYTGYLIQEMEKLGPDGEAFMFHDELGDINDPVYFHQFVEHAARYELQYMVEAELRDVFPHEFSPEARQALLDLTEDVVALEQYMDFLNNRMFRKTLLCHTGVTVNRKLSPKHVLNFSITSRAHPVSETPAISNPSVEQFQAPDSTTLSVDHPVSKAALVYLMEMWPRAVSFADLLTVARARVTDSSDETLARDAAILSTNLLRAYSYSSKLADLHTRAPTITSEAGECPRVSPVARFQAQRHAIVTNLWHERVTLTPFQRYLLSRLDGTRDRASLVEQMTALAQAGDLTLDEQTDPSASLNEVLAEDLDDTLHWMAQAALLEQ